MLDKPFQKCYNNNVESERQHILGILGSRASHYKKVEKVIDKLSTICYNNNVNKNKFKERNEVFSMEKKMTKKEMFALIMGEVAHNEEMVAFLKHEIELLEKKRGSADSKKADAHAKEEQLVKTVLATLGRKVTVTEMLNASAELLAELKTNQKASAVLKRLVDKGEVVKTIEKKVSYFSVV